MGKKYTILVADDDAEITRLLRLQLTAAGYGVATAANGQEALDIVKTRDISLVIMDVMMPVMNGIVATVRLRDVSNIPVLMLSAKAEGSDRVLGLEAGADDYLVKPFYQSELLARVQALLRRYMDLGAADTKKDASLLTIGDITLDTRKKQAVVRGAAVQLTPAEYKILELLMSHPGQVFSAEQIYGRIWENDAYSVENSIMVHISRLRQKIEINPKKPEYLKVKWGIGYLFDQK